MKLLLIYSYGLWIAGVYIVLQSWLGPQLIDGFALGALAGGVILAFLAPKTVLRTARSPIALARAALFGGSQIFLLRALSLGDSTTVFAASTSAVLVTLPLSEFILDEKVNIRNVFGAALAIVGIYIVAPNVGTTLNSMAAGVCQGASIVFARKAGKSSSSLYGNLALGLLIGGLFCLPFTNAAGTLTLTRPIVPISVGACAVTTQLYLLWLSFQRSPNFVNRISQTRIAWSLLISGIFLSTKITLVSSLGCMLILMPAFLFADNLENRNSKA